MENFSHKVHRHESITKCYNLKIFLFQHEKLSISDTKTKQNKTKQNFVTKSYHVITKR